MMPELENLVQKRAHEIWEQEGRPHGRHEEHWRQAAEEVTREIERMKADHQAGASDEGGAGEPAPKGRQRRTKAAGDTPAPRARKASKAGSADEEATAGQETAPTRRRATKPTEGGGAQAEPAVAPARTTRRRSSKAEGA
jgi:hypothetical protein